MKRAILASLLLAACSVGVSGQVVEGTAFDSLSGRPLVGAFISLSSTGKSAISGPEGRFRFDSVPTGRLTLRMQHDVIDSVGLSGVALAIDVVPGVTRVVAAVPSFATLWRAVCPGPPPADSGLIFGHVRAFGAGDTGPPSVVAAWLDVGYDKQEGIKQKRWQFETATDSSGNYAVCGVPTSTAVQLLAIAGPDTSSAIDINPLDRRRVARADIKVRHVDPRLAVAGAIAGTVKTIESVPIDGAEVLVAGTNRGKTDARGRFLIGGLTPGSTSLVVRAIGVGAVSKDVDVRPGDTAEVEIQIAKVTQLDSVTVLGKANVSDIIRTQLAADINDRRTKGFGYFRDSSRLDGYPELSTVFREVPSITVVPKGSGFEVYMPGSGSQTTKGRCLANLWIDGSKQVKLDRDNTPDFTELTFMKPEDIAMIEVYPTMMRTPAQYVVRGSTMSMCGTILVWTKRAVRH